MITISSDAGSLVALARDAFCKAAASKPVLLRWLMAASDSGPTTWPTSVASNVMSGEQIIFNIGLETLHLIVTSSFILFLTNRYVVKRNF